MARSAVGRFMVRRAGRAARMMGSLSADQRAMPDFLIVGTQRGGTTSLFRALLQHPNFMPPRLRKGVHYFDVAYDQGPRWYRGHFPRKAQIAEKSAALAGPVLTGEASPYYMWHPAVPGRIAADLPGVKLIALLRDPVERAYSGHAHEFARGFETEPFERAIELEPGRLAGEKEKLLGDPAARSHAMQHQAHVSRGEYVDQLITVANAVGRENLLVLDSHDYFSDPKPVFTRMCEFLGLPDAPDIEHDVHNARPRSKMSPELEGLLRDHYAPFDARLTEWLGWTPSWRR
jgi:Sulfotransferase domain